jgi:hypothetical protein
MEPVDETGFFNYTACGLRYAATFTVFPHAVSRTPHASLFIPYYIQAKKNSKNRKKVCKKFYSGPRGF